MYKRGDIFEDENKSITRGKDRYYLLAHAGKCHVALFGLVSGNGWKEPVEVKDTLMITDEEFKSISGIGSFKKCDKIIAYLWLLSRMIKGGE